MMLINSQNLGKASSVLMLRNFLVWSFILTVCLLIIGFPLVIMMVVIGSLLSVVLHSVMPAGGVLLIAGGLLGVNVLGVLGVAGLLTLQGIQPTEVSWLTWLHEDRDPLHQPVYASCPLTCDVRGV